MDLTTIFVLALLYVLYRVYMSKYMILAIPDYIFVTPFEFFTHFVKCILADESWRDKLFCADYTADSSAVLGYSCRQLFHSFMDLQTKANPNLKVAVTPLQHTSFRNIVEKFVKPENFQILEMDERYSKIVRGPTGDVDMCIVGHTFGRDMDASVISGAGRKYLLVEDRCQGGTLDVAFSSGAYDISFYSAGMDKRPNALGGGFACFRKGNAQMQKIAQELIEYTKGLPEETRGARFKELCMKIPTYLIYDSKHVMSVLLNLITRVVQPLGLFTLSKFGGVYRKKNPGFDHHNYLRRPSAPTVQGVWENLRVYKANEQTNGTRYDLFRKLLKEKNIKDIYLPWAKDFDPQAITTYNTLCIDKKLHQKMHDFCDFEKFILCMVNPTWKVYSYGTTSESTLRLNENIVYGPNLTNLSDDEIARLVDILAEFAARYKLKATPNGCQ